MSQNCLQRLGEEKEYSMNNKIGRMFCKYVKYVGILLGVLICIPLFCFGIVFISYQIEGWKTEHMIVNEYEDPLAVGEVWEEEPFSFTLERVSLVNAEAWQGQIPFSQSRYKEYDFCKALELEFSFLPKETGESLDDTYSFYPGAQDAEGHVAGPLPLPSSLEGDLTAQDHHCVILTTKNAHVIHITVNVPYGERRYRKVYEFYVNAQE